MLIEDISPESIRRVGNNELKSLQLRFIGLQDKYQRLEKGEGLVTIDWESFSARHDILMKEFEKRRLPRPSWSPYSRDRVLAIKVVGARPPDMSISLLVSHDRHSILVNPNSGAVNELVTEIILTKSVIVELLQHLQGQKQLPVYSSGTIFDELDWPSNRLLLKPLTLDDLTISPLKTIQKKVTGLLFEAPGARVVILPEFINLNKQEQDRVRDSIWITSCDTYETDNTETGRLSFLSLAKVVNELSARALYLIDPQNQTSIQWPADQLKQVEYILKSMPGGILHDGDVVRLTVQKTVLQGIYLVEPHGKWIWEKKKLLIIKAKRFPNMVLKPLILVSGGLAYGVIKLKPPTEIDLDEFFNLAMGHLITETERQKWWPGKKLLYAYGFDVITRYEKPRPVTVPQGVQTFIENVEFRKAGTVGSWGLVKPGYRIFELEDLSNTPGFKEGKIVLEAKFDGLRTKLIKRSGKITITTDPEETATPNKSKRLPWQVKELEKLGGPPGDFAFDSELVMIRDEEVLHRTTANALVNGKFDPTQQSKLAHLYIFDIIDQDGRSTKTYPLNERKELLSKYRDSEHIHFVRSSTTFTKPGLSYVVDLERAADVKKAFDTIMGYAHRGGPFPKGISEGAMFKKLDAAYAGKTWIKMKEEFEVDCLVIGKKPVKDSPGVNVYELAVGPISEQWAEAIRKKDSKAAIEFIGKFYNRTGWSNNSKQKIPLGKILRVSCEDVNKYETENPDYAYYSTYIARVKQPVPEKKSPDGMAVLERLSALTPKRARLKKEAILAQLAQFPPEELERIARLGRRDAADPLINGWRPERSDEPTAEMLQKAEEFWKAFRDDVNTSVEAGKIPKQIYERYAKEGEPLPEGFYNDYREGDGFAQTHIRGLESDDVDAYKAKKISLAELFERHSIHIDLRMDLGEKKLIQWVILESDLVSYTRYLRGEQREIATGRMAVQHALAVVKPSAEEPQERLKKAENKELILSPQAAKQLADLQIIKRSYFIPPGAVGSTREKYAWMGLIWEGKVKTGVQRKDFHEYFLCPDDKLPEANSSFFNGKFVVKCLKREKDGARWETWKAAKDPRPADSILHVDSGWLFPVPANEIKAFGREHYKFGQKEPTK